MADDIDRANDLTAKRVRAAEERIRQAARRIPTGEPGECDHCGEENARLVNGLCSPCRDFLKC